MPVASEKQIHEPTHQPTPQLRLQPFIPSLTHALTEKTVKENQSHQIVFCITSDQMHSDYRKKQTNKKPTPQNSRGGEVKWEADKKVHDP